MPFVFPVVTSFRLVCGAFLRSADAETNDESAEQADLDDSVNGSRFSARQAVDSHPCDPLYVRQRTRSPHQDSSLGQSDYSEESSLVIRGHHRPFLDSLRWEHPDVFAEFATAIVRENIGKLVAR